ncbi:hypothetical protein Tco_1174891 [Tanacetum coccineum]
MANLLEDIQCAGSDTRPPMLDRTDFASWQQRICLYCRGKENGVNIGNGYSLKDKNQVKTDKTEHGIGKSVKSKKVKVNQVKSQSRSQK